MGDFLEIEMARRDAGLSISRVCNIARVNRSTYYRMQKRPGSGRAETLRQLKTAITYLKGNRA